MKSRLIASVLAAALALTAVTTSPVEALDQGERNRLVLGLGALAIIGALANQNRRHAQPQVTYDNHRWDDRDDRRDRRDGRYDRDRYGRNWLPASCEFSVRTRQGTRNVLGKSCLSQSDIRVSRLPSSCEFDIRTSRGTREVFSSRCLKEQGYRIEARR